MSRTHDQVDTPLLAIERVRHGDELGVGDRRVLAYVRLDLLAADLLAAAIDVVAQTPLEGEAAHAFDDPRRHHVAGAHESIGGHRLRRGFRRLVVAAQARWPAKTQLARRAVVDRLVGAGKAHTDLVVLTARQALGVVTQRRRQMGTGAHEKPFGRAVQVEARHAQVGFERIGAAHRAKQHQRRQVMAGNVLVGDHLRRHGPDRQTVGDAVRLDQREHAGDIDARHEHGRHAGGDGRCESIQLTGVVQQWQRPDHAAMLGHADVAHPGQGVAQVFRMKTRNDLRHARRAARELEAQHVFAADAHVGQYGAGALERHVVDQPLDGVLRPSLGGACPSRDQQMFQRGVPVHHLLREADQIERREIRLHEIGSRLGLRRELADLDFAILRHRAHRHDTRLVGAHQRYDSVDGGAHLEDRPVARTQPQRDQRRTEPLTTGVERRE